MSKIIWYVGYDKQRSEEPIYTFKNGFSDSAEKDALAQAREFRDRMIERGYRTKMWFESVDNCYDSVPSYEPKPEFVPQARTRSQIMQDHKDAMKNDLDEPSFLIMTLSTLGFIVALLLCISVFWW